MASLRTSTQFSSVIMVYQQLLFYEYILLSIKRPNLILISIYFFPPEVQECHLLYLLPRSQCFAHFMGGLETGLIFANLGPQYMSESQDLSSTDNLKAINKLCWWQPEVYSRRLFIFPQNHAPLPIEPAISCSLLPVRNCEPHKIVHICQDLFLALGTRPSFLTIASSFCPSKSFPGPFTGTLNMSTNARMIPAKGGSIFRHFEQFVCLFAAFLLVAQNVYSSSSFIFFLTTITL